MADSKYEEERRDEAALRELLRRDFAAQSAAVRIVDRAVVEKKVDVKPPRSRE